IEHEVAAIGAREQDGMPVAELVENNRDQEIAGRPAALHEEFALQQYVVLAVAVALRQSPEFVAVIVLKVGDRTDAVVDREVDVLQVAPACFGKVEGTVGSPRDALVAEIMAKVDIAYRRIGRFAEL